MDIGKLKILLVPPNGRKSDNEVNWKEVEDKFGIAVPDDFKEIISVYGTGSIDRFIWILNPESKNDNLNFDKAEYFLSSYSVMKQDYPKNYPRPQFPAEGSFFPWAVTDNGETFVWIVEGAPNDWKIAIQGVDQETEEVYEMSTIEFLVALLSKKIKSKILPEEFPSDDVEFTVA